MGYPAPVDTYTAHLLHMRLRDYLGRGRRIVRARGLIVIQECRIFNEKESL